MSAVSHGLFRKQALDSKQLNALGSIRLAQPIRFRVLAVFAAMAALVMITLLVLGSYARRTHVVGQLVPVQGMAQILAPATGIITRIDIPEGGHVEAGQVVAVLKVPRTTQSSGDTLTALETRLQRRIEGLHATHAAQQQQFSVQASGLSSQLQTARRELMQIETEISTQHEQVRIAQDTLERLRELEDGHYVSLLQIKQQESVALAQVSQLQGLQRQAIASRRLITQLEQALAELPDQRHVSEAGFQRDLAVLEQEQIETVAQNELVITAPVDGIIAAQLFKPGQTIRAGQSLLSLLPGEGKLEAELWVPSRAIGFTNFSVSKVRL